MNDDTLNIQLRKFLKEVGVTSQRAIEDAVRQAIDGGKLKGTERVRAVMTLELPDLGTRHVVEGTIALE
jgi:hypothetical protein